MLNTRLGPSHSFNSYSLSTNGLTHTRDHAGPNTLIKAKKKSTEYVWIRSEGEG